MKKKDRTKEIRERFAAFPFINATKLSIYLNAHEDSIRFNLSARDPIPLRYQDKLFVLLDSLEMFNQNCMYISVLQDKRNILNKKKITKADDNRLQKIGKELNKIYHSGSYSESTKILKKL